MDTIFIAKLCNIGLTMGEAERMLNTVKGGYVDKWHCGLMFHMGMKRISK